MLDRIIFGITGITLSVAILIYNVFKEKNDSFITFFEGGMAGCAFTLSLLLFFAPVKSTTEYVPAVLACQNEFSTYFYDVSSGHIFHVETKYSYADDCPYLLDVETHGTESKLDDEVLVVWRTD